MTDRTQFEAMLEALINEDQETAKEIFHNIVVAKSREIYEELLDSDFNLKVRIHSLKIVKKNQKMTLKQMMQKLMTLTAKKMM